MSWPNENSLEKRRQWTCLVLFRQCARLVSPYHPQEGWAGSSVWTYAYYDDGSLYTITAPEGTYTYEYNEVGQPTEVTYPNDSSVQYTYDKRHNTSVIEQLRVDAGRLARYAYSYGFNYGDSPARLGYLDLINAVSEQFRGTDQTLYGPYSTTFAYDPYQLVSAVYPEYDSGLSVPWSNSQYDWEYDAIGNRTLQTGGGDTATYTYNLSGVGPQLSGVTHTNGDPSVSFTYDDNGNVATQVVNSQTPVTTTYTWDYDDKLYGVTTSDSSVTEDLIYAYNGDRLQRALNASTWKYLYSKEDILKADDGGESGPVFFTQGPGIDDILTKTQGETTTYAYKNMLSSVATLTDDASAVTSMHLYNAWGEATNWPSPASDLNPYGYTGREWESPSVYYYRNRFYRPDIGRFLSVDPLMSGQIRASDAIQLLDGGKTRRLGGTSSYPGRGARQLQYAYVSNRPLQMVDPFGLQAWFLGTSVYQNWCGPGGGGPAMSALDEACEGHDKCYATCGISGIGGATSFNPGTLCCKAGCDAVLCLQAYAYSPDDFNSAVARQAILEIFCWQTPALKGHGIY